jgi:hypothetical protein
MAKKLSVVGIFAYLDEVVAALKELKKEKVQIDSVYSPMPRHEIREVLGVPQLGPGRFFTLAGGIVGIFTGIFLVWYTASQWRFVVGGKPPIPVYPTVIPAFEFFILISVFFTLAGLLIKNRMPKMRLSAHFDKRFTQDRFGIVVYCTDGDREKISGILKESGAEEVRQVEE